jgi:hypothetical protein
MSPKPLLPVLAPLVLVAVIAVAACSSAAQNPASPAATAASSVAASQSAPSAVTSAGPTFAATPAAAATPDAAATPAAFTSEMYDYSLTVPAGWSSLAAMLPYDGTSGLGHASIEVDKFVGPAVDVFSWAQPFAGNLPELVQATIDQNVRDHSDTCPTPRPEVIEPIDVGGRPGRLLGWNCGILINEAVTVHDGIAYTFVLRDLGLAAASDPADRALLEELLDSVTFPS